MWKMTQARIEKVKRQEEQDFLAKRTLNFRQKDWTSYSGLWEASAGVQALGHPY